MQEFQQRFLPSRSMIPNDDQDGIQLKMILRRVDIFSMLWIHTDHFDVPGVLFRRLVERKNKQKKKRDFRNLHYTTPRNPSTGISYAKWKTHSVIRLITLWVTNARNCLVFSVISNFSHTFCGVFIVMNKIFLIFGSEEFKKIEIYVNSSFKDIHQHPQMILESFEILMLELFRFFAIVLHRKRWWNLE